MKHNLYMKITILYPEKEFTKEQLITLNSLGDVIFLDPPLEHSLEEYKNIAMGSDILAVDPDNFGGFDSARSKLSELIGTIPNLKGLALDTTSFGWVDLEYCKNRKIAVTNIPGYSRESVAEHTIALMLAVSKRILISDRRTQRGEYKLMMGTDLKGKTIGIIGLGNIGSRVAEIAQGFGMKVIAYNRSPKRQTGVKMLTFKEVLQQSDFLTIHTTHEDKNRQMFAKEQFDQMKEGVVIVNTIDRDMFNEQDLAEAIQSRKVSGYIDEAGSTAGTPLEGLENAFGMKSFGWYTKESMENLMEIWVDNIVSLAKDKPLNPVG